jgi:hypothetical protein
MIFSSFVLFVSSFENRVGERSLTSFEMTDCHSEPQARNLSVAFSLAVGERKLMNHFVVISPISIDDGFWIKYRQCETVHKF